MQEPNCAWAGKRRSLSPEEVGRPVPEERFRRATLVRRVVMEGIGLHSGKPARLTVSPAPPGSGWRFVRTDLPELPEIPVEPGAVRRTPLCTTLTGEAGAEVATVEHLLAALRGLGLTDVRLELEGPEVPLGDGSAAAFADLLVSGGLAFHPGKERFLSLSHAVGVSRGEASLVAVPAEEPRFTYVFTHPHPAVGVQVAEFVPGRDDFRACLAPARTIGFLADVERLRAQGLALGGSLESAVVIGEDGYVGPLRFPNEVARHKLLDLFGDLAMIPPVRAHVIGLRSGHALNAALAEEILGAAGD